MMKPKKLRSISKHNRELRYKEAVPLNFRMKYMKTEFYLEKIKSEQKSYELFEQVY